MERVGRSRRGQTALRRDPLAAETGRGRGRIPARPNSTADQVRLRPSALSQADRERAGRDRRRRVLPHRRPRSVAARRRQVHPRPAAAQGLRRPGCARRGAAARRPDDEPSPRSCATAREHRIAVVPFGGGTSVVGGLDPIRGEFRRRGVARSAPLRPADLPRRGVRPGRFRRRRHRAGRRTTARRTRLFARAFPAELRIRHHRRLRRDPLVGPGLGGLRPVQRHGSRAAHGHPGRHAWTWAAHRSRPRAPTCASCSSARRAPSASSPRCGCACTASPKPSATRRGRSPTSRPGAAALRAVTQTATGPTVIRLSDEAETGVNLATTESIGDSQITGGCLGITVFEGTKEHVESRHAETSALLAAQGGTSLGEAPARAWERGRFGAPYLRDSLLAGGRALRDARDRHRLVQHPRAESRCHRKRLPTRWPRPAPRRW